MRAGLRIVSLLICGLIVAYLWGNSVSSVSSANKAVRPQVNQIAGRSADGTPAGDSATFAAVKRGGNFAGLKVTAIDPRGGLAEHYGLQAGDVILRIGPFQM